MKSRPIVLYLVLGAAAVALYFAWLSANRHGSDVATLPPGGPQTTATPAGTLAAAQNSTPTAAPMVPAPATALPLASGSPPPTPIGDTTGQAAASLPASIVNPNEPGPAPNQAAQIEVGKVRHMISDFHTLMGENPVGTNAEIMKQMMGGNSHQATLGPPEGISLNSQGELVDQWGTAYFFHQLSRDKMEVRSAGPDKIMWTADDVIAR